MVTLEWDRVGAGSRARDAMLTHRRSCLCSPPPSSVCATSLSGSSLLFSGLTRVGSVGVGRRRSEKTRSHRLSPLRWASALPLRDELLMTRHREQMASDADVV